MEEEICPNTLGIAEVMSPEELRIRALEEKIAEQEKKINELDEALNIKFRIPDESHP